MAQPMFNRKSGLLVALGLLMAATLSACGGGSSPGAFQSASSSSGSTSPGTTVQSLTMTTSGATIPADGSGSATITATALNSGNATVSGVAVNFTVTTGALVTVTQGTTDTNGTATATVKANGAASGSTVTVTATAGTVTNKVNLTAINATQTVTVTSSAPTLASNNSSPLTITALVRSASNQVISGVPVTFTVNHHAAVSPATVTTTASGTATATLTTGGDPTNYSDIIVTATTSLATGSVTVQETGTAITLSGPSNLIQGGTAGQYSVSLVDSGGTGIANQTVTMTSAAGNTVTPASQLTNASGQATFQIAPTQATSPDTLTVSGAGASQTQKVTISSQSFSFGATPAANSSFNVNTSTPISVTWQSGGSPVSGQTVSFSTTRGVFGASATATATTNSSGVATVNLTSATSGPVTVTATAGSGSSAVSAQLPLVAVATTPATLVLQASPSTVPLQGTSTITATVTDSANNLVANQVVVFSLTDSTGGSISQASVATNNQGVAQTQYNATSTASAYQGVVVNALVQGTAVSAQPVKLTVGGSTVFLSLGTGAILSENATLTQFYLPYTVLAVDAAGNPVSGAQVTLQVKSNSLSFRKGYWAVPTGGSAWAQYVTATCTSGSPNLDPGSVASVSPGTVTTDATGSANFNVIYPEDHAQWDEVILTVSASVQGQGSQSSSSATFWLPQLAKYVNNIQANPPGVDSPYGIGTNCTNTN